MKSLISDDRRRLFEQLEERDHEAKRWENMFSQNRSSTLNPSALTMAMQFQEVDDIDQFQVDYMLWMQERRVELQKKELVDRLNNLDTEGIIPGKAYKDYAQRFQYMLDTISLLGELGEMDQALQLINQVLLLAEIAPAESDPELLTLQWILRSDALWTIANIFDQEDLYYQAFECMESALRLAQAENHFSVSISKHIAKRYLSLADSGDDSINNLNSAENLLAPLAQAYMLDSEGWGLYFRVLMKLSDYKKAYKASQEMIKAASIEGKKIHNIALYEVVAAEYLSRYITPRDFLIKFGPFACPIYAECKKIYLSEAWAEIYNEALPILAKQQSIGTAFLMGNVVIYEENDPLLSQPAIILHELIHMGVSRGQVYQSEGKWLKAYRDVPTAALFTYMNQIEKAQESGIALPDSLHFFVELGRNAFKNESEKCDYYIEKMLEYFEQHGQETNSAYQCAGIQAGMLLDMIGTPGSEEMHSYIFHLEVTDHKNAIEKSKRKVALII